MNEGQKIVCRATAINHQAMASAEILVVSDSERRSISIKDSQDFPVSVGDKIFCMVGKITVSVPKKPNIKLFTLSSRKIEHHLPTDSQPPGNNNKMVIEERIFNVMKILSK